MLFKMEEREREKKINEAVGYVGVIIEKLLQKVVLECEKERKKYFKKILFSFVLVINGFFSNCSSHDVVNVVGFESFLESSVFIDLHEQN